MSNAGPDATSGQPRGGEQHAANNPLRDSGGGVLNHTWSAWFDGLDVSGDSDAGITTIAGPLPDQAALHGLLVKIRDLGIPLLEVRRIGSDFDPRRK